ncbi:MAG: prolyl oligopeptidase family serine peptidase [Oscillospiraceae bacterium]|nr:prolyl oligopeptidase family serine peptidase [Oscillospiraceae bacterium]
MKKHGFAKTLALLSAICITGCSFAACSSGNDESGEGLSKRNFVEESEQLTYQVYFEEFDTEINMAYRLFVPQEESPKEPYPVLLFLHGSGERGEDNERQVKTNMDILYRLTEDEELYKKYPCIIIAPQCPDQFSWSDNILDSTVKLVEEVQEKYNADKERLYVMGISMGGFGTWELLKRYPEKIAAAVPICGGGDPEAVENFKDVPIWAFHGDRDFSVDVQYSRDMADALDEAGNDVIKHKYTEYPLTDHGGSWHRAYLEPELLSWIFSQRGNP